MAQRDPFAIFAVTAPGLEPVAAGELRALGVEDAVAEPGGVGFRGDATRLYAANLHLRTASRVVVRVAEFSARTFFELERHARKVPWEAYLSPAQPVRVRVTCRKSRLYHSDAVAERMLSAIAHRVGAIGLGAVVHAGDEERELDERRGERSDAGEGEGESPGERDAAGAQLFTIRFLHDRCTVSADSSGALLHLRGYRQAVAKAPVRETLAAAVLLASGWRGDTPLVDPFCGSGTIAIEGALLARRLPPGLGRKFAFMEWPSFAKPTWDTLQEQASNTALSRSPMPIIASDRDAGAVAAAEGNAERAGVGGDVEVRRHALSAIEMPRGAGHLATNPPYGVRVGDTRDLKDLYAALGQVARAKARGWTVALLAADRMLAGRAGLPLRQVLRTTNGGIPVELLAGVVPAE